MTAQDTFVAVTAAVIFAVLQWLAHLATVVLGAGLVAWYTVRRLRRTP